MCTRTTRANSIAERLADLRQLAQAPEVVAIGECGLDYFRDLSPRAAQQQAFHRQLELARALGKPVFLHQRDAHADFAAILREHAGEWRGVAHCFTGTAERTQYLSGARTCDRHHRLDLR